MAQEDTQDGLSMYGRRRLRIMLDATRATGTHIGRCEECYREQSKDQVTGTDLILIPIIEKFI